MQPQGVFAHPQGCFAHPYGVYSHHLGVCGHLLGVCGHPIGVYGHPIGVFGNIDGVCDNTTIDGVHPLAVSVPFEATWKGKLLYFDLSCQISKKKNLFCFKAFSYQIFLDFLKKYIEVLFPPNYFQKYLDEKVLSGTS